MSHAHPSATVGVIGGGQLARMLHEASIRLGVEVVCLTTSSDDPAGSAGASIIIGAPDDPVALRRLAERCDVVTVEHERTPVHELRHLEAEGFTVRPGASTQRLSQDKAWFRHVMRTAGRPVPDSVLVAPGDVHAIDEFGDRHGWPLIVKAPTGGYDGRGVRVAHSRDDILVRREPLLVERRVAIAVELAVLVVRRPAGEVVTYPVVETVQHDGICRELMMPARVDESTATRAVALARSIANDIDAAGVMAVELFVDDTGAVWVNEIATRPHNSGHATIDACVTSQFENHLRAVLDWPLGSTQMRSSAAAMVNLLGPSSDAASTVRLTSALDVAGASVHLYRKAPRPGRKLGHVTVTADAPTDALAAAREAARRVFG